MANIVQMRLRNIVFCESDLSRSLEYSLNSLGFHRFEIIDISNTDVRNYLESAWDHLGHFCLVSCDRTYSKLYPNNFVYKNANYDIIKISKEIIWIFTNFGKDKHMTDKTFFWSDPHFFHKNIIKYCDRPWNDGKDENNETIVTDDNVLTMNEALIENFNSVVPKDGITWCLGDFCLGPDQKTHIPEIVSRLNGKVNLVLGNHDHHDVKFYYEAGFNKVYDRPVIINDFVVLSHAPMQFVKAPFFNIYGHVHDSDTFKTWSKDGCCVCVERHEYKPVSWKQIQEKFDELNET